MRLIVAVPGLLFIRLWRAVFRIHLKLVVILPQARLNLVHNSRSLTYLPLFAYARCACRSTFRSPAEVHFFAEGIAEAHPHPGEVYNIGGGRTSNCSMLGAIALCEDITGKKHDLR